MEITHKQLNRVDLLTGLRVLIEARKRARDWKLTEHTSGGSSGRTALLSPDPAVAPV
jgi:hypothetical protein